MPRLNKQLLTKDKANAKMQIEEVDIKLKK